MRPLLSILLLATFTTNAQINLTNKGTSLAMYIAEGLTVHVDGSVANEASATMQFKSS